MAITKQRILSKVDSKDIFDFYIAPFSNGEVLKAKKTILSPLRVESNPSFNIYQARNCRENGNAWRFKDFAGEQGSCFDFVMKLFNLPFSEALIKINNDMNLKLEENPIEISNSITNNTRVNNSVEIIFDEHSKCKTKQFSERELSYWLDYGITLEHLKYFNVEAIDIFTGYSKKRDKPYSIESHKEYPIFGYINKDFAKIYKPFDTMYRFQYLGSKPSDFIFGLKQLPQNGDVLFITGGEKDVISLYSHGYHAISLNSETSSFDTKKCVELKERFKNIIVLYDNDKTGMEASESLSVIHNLTRIVLPPMENGKDISDFFKSKQPIQNLKDWIKNAIHEYSLLTCNNEQIEDQCIFTITELLTRPKPETRYLLEPILPKYGTALLVGKPDTGKSQLARQLAIQVSIGRDKFLDFQLITKYQRALYIATEDDPENTQFLASKQYEGIAALPKDNLKIMFADTLTKDQIIEKLNKELQELPCDLVVIDSFGDVFNGSDLNSNTQMRNCVKEFDRIAKKYYCLILFVHHINKNSYTQAPAQQHIQGGGGLVQKTRSAIHLTSGEDNKKYLNVSKGNYCPREYKQNAIELIFDEQSFVFTPTGKTVPIESLGTDNNIKEEKEEKENIQTLRNIAEVILKEGKILKYTQLVDLYKKRTAKSEATAKRNIKRMLQLEIIKNIDGLYSLNVKENEEAEAEERIEEELAFDGESKDAF